MGEKPVAFRQKLLAAMRDIGSIAKAGKNEKQGYAFQKASDILAATQQAFIKNGLIFLSCEEGVQWLDSHETQGGATMFAVQATMRYTILDADQQKQPDGSDFILVATHSGIGFDTSDKALNKAKTQSLKYFLKGTFLIGEDDDEDDADKHHIEAKPKSDRPACPKCGAVGTIIKGKAEYGGGWLCFGKKGGCGARFTTDPAIRTKGARQGTKAPEPIPPPPEPEDESQEPPYISEEDWKYIDAVAAAFPNSQVEIQLKEITRPEYDWLLATLKKKGRTITDALQWVGASAPAELTRQQFSQLQSVLNKAGKP